MVYFNRALSFPWLGVETIKRHSGRDCRNPEHRDVKIYSVANATVYFNASSRTGGRDAACFLRSSVLTGVVGRDFLSLRQRAPSLPHPYGRFPPKPPVLGAAYGNGVFVAA